MLRTKTNNDAARGYEEIQHTAGDGVHRLYKFPNGYGASVVRFNLGLGLGYGSYTSNENEWEVAVVKLKPELGKSLFSSGFDICYDTPLTDDVIGHVSDNNLDELLAQIAALPKAEGMSQS